MPGQRPNPIRPPTRRYGCTRRRRRGQILIMALLALTLLVGMIFYVFNVGDLMNRRLALQHAADATAIGGGDWMARSMNAVALNNCAQTRMLSLVTIFDAAPLAAEMSWKEAEAWEYGLAQQLARGVPATKNDFLRDGLENLRQRMATQRDILDAFSRTLNEGAYDMRLATHWAVPGAGGTPPHGAMWQTAVALQDFSETVVDSAGVLAQADGVRFGLANRADVAFVVPVLPELPGRPGEFEDFRDVLKTNMSVLYEDVSGGGIPDFADPHRWGPWPKLYEWRDKIWEIDGRWVPTTSVVGRPGLRTGGRSVGGVASQGGSGYWTEYSRRYVGFQGFGPWEALMRRIYMYAGYPTYFTKDDSPRYGLGVLADTYFYTYLRDLAKIKLNYMFPAVAGQFDPPVVSYHYPNWICVDDYPAAQAQALSGADIAYTMFYLVEVASSVPPSSASWMSPGTYRTNADEPLAVWSSGWQDPATWNIQQVAPYIWREEATYMTTQDPEIGIQPIPVSSSDPDGPLRPQPVYLVRYYVWGGIDVGGQVEIRNPCNWDEFDDLPYPILYDPGEDGEDDYDPEDLDPDAPARRKMFTYLGVAQDRTTARVWPSQFRHINPLGHMAAVAQAKVFNHSSWDLWTQNWQAQLTPVTDWADWIERIDAGEGDVEYVDDMVYPDEFGVLAEYLYAIDPDMAEMYFNH